MLCRVGGLTWTEDRAVVRALEHIARLKCQNHQNYGMVAAVFEESIKRSSDVKLDAESMLIGLNKPYKKNDRYTLCEQVRTAVEKYFIQINEFPICNLYDMVIGEVEKPLIETVMSHFGNNQTKAAKALGISRVTLRKKIDRYQLK